jgi:hypothetical protein
MSMPGFAAEVSLYRTTGHYRTSGKFDGQGGAVALAQAPPGSVATYGYCTYGPCLPILEFYGAEPYPLKWKVIGWRRQRCCTLTGCTWVGCPDKCLEWRTSWYLDCLEALLPDYHGWYALACWESANRQYQECLQTGVWPNLGYPIVSA